jgi:hypothetical protein
MSSSTPTDTDRVIDAVRESTGDPQPPGVKPTTLYGVCAIYDGSMGRQTIERALTSAVADGDLFRWRDWNGAPRYSRVTADAVKWVRETDDVAVLDITAAACHKCIGEANQRDDLGVDYIEDLIALKEAHDAE